MKKYDSYKDVRLKWMGVIPKHWIITKNRYGFIKCNNGKNESDDTNVLSLTTKGVKVKKNLNFGKSTESYIGHQLVEIGDIVFTPRDFDQTPILSDVSKFNGCISNLYIVDKTKKGVLNYFVNYYWYGLKYSVDYFKIFSHGMRYSFNRFQFDEIPLLIPPLSEQQQIVEFLDVKTNLIDTLIEKTQRKIQLLKEQRTSLINLLVTKGLNPNVKLKDSGVEWIGEIPEHWESVKVKYFVSFDSGFSFKSDDYIDDGIPLIRIGSLYNNTLSLDRSPVFLPLEFVNEYFQFVVKVNDILISMTGTLGKRDYGYSILYNEDFPSLLNQRVGRIRIISKKIVLNYLMYVMLSESFLLQLFSKPTGTKQGNLSSDDITGNYFGLPSLTEQQQLVEFLDKKTNLIDTTISKEQKRIELLKEYRQSLISNVVTGKLKVTKDE